MTDSRPISPSRRQTGPPQTTASSLPAPRAASVTAAAAPRMVAVERLTAHPGNVRDDVELTDEFCASVADNGVRLPPPSLAGTTPARPITRASITRRAVLARHARNKRLADAIYLQAFAALTASPAPGPFTATAAPPGDTHPAHHGKPPGRILGGCPAKHTPCDEDTPGHIWPPSKPPMLLDSHSRGMSSGPLVTAADVPVSVRPGAWGGRSPAAPLVHGPPPSLP